MAEVGYKRGAYNTKRKQANKKPVPVPKKKAASKPAKKDERTPEELYADTVDYLIDESPMVHANAKKVLAETVAMLRVQMLNLKSLQMLGAITAEESKTIPSVASNIRRNLEALGVTEFEKPEDKPL